MKFCPAFAYAALVIAFHAPPLIAATLYDIKPIDLEPRAVGPTGINNHGAVVGWFRQAMTQRPFYWDDSRGFIDLATVSAFEEGEALEINNDGGVVGWFAPPESPMRAHAFLWAFENGLSDLGSGLAYALNDRGQAAGQSGVMPIGAHAHRWNNAGEKQDLGTLGRIHSFAFDMNESGTIVGSSNPSPLPSPSVAFRWNAADGMQALPTPLGNSSSAQAINNRGDVAGSISGEATVWTNDGSVVNIGVLTGNFSSASAINDRQEVVGAFQDLPDGYQNAFIWDSINGSRELLSLLPENSGWTRLDSADDINDSGQIVGRGIYNGVLRAYLMTPVPEPSTRWMAAAAIASTAVLAATKYLFRSREVSTRNSAVGSGNSAG